AVAAARSFPDHHRYTPADVRSLCTQADAEGLTLVTTEKDLARLAGDAAVAEFAARVRALPVRLVFDDDEALKQVLRERIAAARGRVTACPGPGNGAAARPAATRRPPADRRSSI